MSADPPLQFSPALERRALESLADGVLALIMKLVQPARRVEFVGYLLMWSIADRMKGQGPEAAAREVTTYIAEAIATGLDVGSDLPGHRVQLSVIQPGAEWPRA